MSGVWVGSAVSAGEMSGKVREMENLCASKMCELVRLARWRSIQIELLEHLLCSLKFQVSGQPIVNR